MTAPSVPSRVINLHHRTVDVHLPIVDARTLLALVTEMVGRHPDFPLDSRQAEALGSLRAAILRVRSKPVD